MTIETDSWKDENQILHSKNIHEKFNELVDLIELEYRKNKGPVKIRVDMPIHAAPFKMGSFRPLIQTAFFIEYSKDSALDIDGEEYDRPIKMSVEQHRLIGGGGCTIVETDILMREIIEDKIKEK